MYTDDTHGIVDADPQIALSDLVAHGEVSRLRRRGALHGRHRSDVSSSVSSGYTNMPPLRHRDPDQPSFVRWPRSIHDLGLDNDGPVEEEEEGLTYALFCGEDGDDEEEDDEEEEVQEEWRPSILPGFPPKATSRKTKPGKPATGCGSLLHRSVRFTPTHEWVSTLPPTTSVVPLPSTYLDQSEQVMTYGADPVGCAVWCVYPTSSIHSSTDMYSIYEQR